MNPDRITFRCLEVIQPIGTFYIGAIDSADLVAISYADIRRIEERDIEKYLGIQRTLSDQRVGEISQYVKTIDATFPTAVILAVRSEDAEYNLTLAAMSLARHDGVAKIIDGQHRIAGLKGYIGPTFLVNVAIFVDMDIEDQATVFATINLSQTKVKKSLVYDLYDYAKSRSPQKTSHNIARVLNREEGSPFLGKIMILGRATPGGDETLTQATFVESLLPYISKDKDRIVDRDLLKRGKQLTPAEGSQDPRFLRNMFIAERDADITLLIWNYFSAVRRRWPNAWAKKEKGNVLNRTTGFTALMKFLPLAVRSFDQWPLQIPMPEFFETIFSNVSYRDEDFTPDNFAPGGSGASKLLRDLVAQTRIGQRQIAAAPA